MPKAITNSNGATLFLNKVQVAPHGIQFRQDVRTSDNRNVT